MDLLSLLGACNLAGTNSPDWLVCHDDLAPVLQLLLDSLELLGHNIDCEVVLALLEGLSTAEDHTDVTVNGSLGLGGDKGIVFLEDDTALRVAEEGPCNVAVLELLDGDLTGEGTVRLVEDVLCCYFDAGLEVLAGEKEVEGRRSNDNLCGELADVELRAVLRGTCRATALLTWLRKLRRAPKREEHTSV